MCSVAGDVLTAEPNTYLNSFRNGSPPLCKKCSLTETSVVLRKTDSYCKACFISAVVHKFRATLGKHRIVRPNDRVLILYRNGHPSSALLHFVKSATNLATHKKLRIDPVVLYIDVLYKIPPEERFNMCKNISKEISSYNFPAYITSLQDFIKNSKDTQKIIPLNDNLERSFFEDLTKTHSTTQTQNDDISDVYRRQLLIQAAKQLKCQVVFTPEITADVAIKMLSNVSLGRGSHLSLDTGMCDNRDSEVKILQPLRYFDMKELAFYNIFHDINPISLDASLKPVPSTSVNTLITKFVHDLQENYPATINTVVRTCDKLTCVKTELKCSICKAPVEIQKELSSAEARYFSHWVSTHANQLGDNGNFNPAENCQDEENSLCYACKKIVNAMKK